MRPERIQRSCAPGNPRGQLIAPVSLRLISADRGEIDQLVTRLKEFFGEELHISNPNQSGRGLEWIAYGTFI